MGKPQKKMPQAEGSDKQQAKISAFFQTGAKPSAASHSASTSSSKPSHLFSHVGQQSGGSRSASNPPESAARCPTYVVDSDDDGGIIPDTPELVRTAAVIPVKPASTRILSHKSTPSDSLKESAKAKLPNEEESDVIPDTPVSNERLKSKKIYNRSFLLSGSNLGPPKKKPSKAELLKLKRLEKSAKTLEERLKENEAKEFAQTGAGPSVCKWKNDDVNFVAAAADLGIPFHHSVKPAGLSNHVQRSKLSKISPAKRLRSLKRPSSKGESPNPKRFAKSDSSSLKPAAAANDAKRRLDLTTDAPDKTLKNVSTKANERFSDEEKEEEEEPEFHLQNGVEIAVQSSDPTTFRWGKKKSVHKSNLSDSTKTLRDDSTLASILTKIKADDQVPVPSFSSSDVSIVPPVPHFKKPAKLATVMTETNNLEDDSDSELPLMDTEDADEAFDGLIDELRHRLADTPKYLKKQSVSNRPSYGPKVGKGMPQCAPSTVISPVNDSSPEMQKTPRKDTGERDSETSTKMECVTTPSSQSRTPAAQSDATFCSPQQQGVLTTELEGERLARRLSRDFSQFSPFKESADSATASDKQPQSFSRVDNWTISADAPVAVYGRHRVVQIVEERTEKVLDLVSVVDGCERTAVLQGFWFDTHVKVEDIVHVVGEFTPDGHCHVTDTQNLIIVNPDLLISGTTVVSTVKCMRRSVLNEKFKGCDSRNIFMLYGSIIHGFFQKILEDRSFSKSAMEKTAKEIVSQSKFLHEMYAIGVTEEAVMEEIAKYLPTTLQFVEKHVPPKQYSLGQKQHPDVNTTITDIADIEENVWCPRYGIKGKIDLTVEVKIRKDRNSKWSKKLMPLELKTGKPTHSIEHKGQVTLYSMMLADRRPDPESGLLLYLRDGSLTNIPASYANKRGLIQLRNELAHYLKSSMEKSEDSSENNLKFQPLPRPINSERDCGWCPHVLNCAAYQRTMEDLSLPPNHHMSKLVPGTLSHLKDIHLEYFSHWCGLLHLEASMGTKRGGSGLKAIWCKTGVEREKDGECLSGMVLMPDQCTAVEGERFLQTFCRQPSHNSGDSLSDVGLSKSDSVVVGAENKPLIALCTGSIQQIDAQKVTILTDRDLRLYPDHTSLQFRLDKSDIFNTSSYYFTNLSRIMENTDKSAKLREVVIERRAPQFDLTMSKSVIEKVKDVFRVLNKPQKTAVLKVLMCRDYVLIKGYPGTGKTSTIVALVRILCTLGHSVLLASYTHSAVDNILLKLKKHKVDFVRIGRLERIHPDIHSHAAELLTRPLKSVQALADFYQSKPVVATTCLGTNHVLFTQRTFDVCIVDEASQVLQPACFGPLLCSRKFVLVGDPLQLPPVVQSREARDLGMAESLFARLDDSGATYELNVQYRMNKEIMRLSNELVYSGALKCGSASIANSRLRLPNLARVLPECPSWLQEVMSAQGDRDVQFLDTGGVGAKSSTDELEGGVRNELEASIATSIVKSVVKAGLNQEDIGLIAPYRQQVRLLRDSLAGHDLLKVEVNTVDQYQGRDKALIIMSFVKAKSQDSSVSQILQDMRRLNVALTRAKHMQVMIGCAAVLKTYTPIAQLMDILHPGQLVSLPATTPQDCAGMLSDTSLR